MVGIGIVPVGRPADRRRRGGANGVDVDPYCRTSLPDVYAIGDCAAHANPYAGGAVIRLESVQNANDMANTAARAICGDRAGLRGGAVVLVEPVRPAGCRPSASASATTRTVRAATRRAAASRWSISRAGRWSRSTASTATKDYAQGRKLVEARAMIAPEVLLDAETPLKELL